MCIPTKATFFLALHHNKGTHENNSNVATIRDHYPLPIIDHVIEQVARAKAYSFLDGCLGYIQISISPKYQHKMAFASKGGTFAYKVMLFVLIYAPSTFQ